MFKSFLSGCLILCGAVLMGHNTVQAGPNDSAWIHLFNKADTSLRTNWDIHIAGQQLNVDPRNTYRWAVVGSDTVMDVNTTTYANWTGNPWGHIGYKARSFKYFLVRAEHQFYASQPSGAPSWALQNNGIMMGQSIATMGVNQDYPISLENQLLGPGNVDADNNSTANLCTPGTAFYTTATGGSVNTNHCTSANTLDRSKGLTPNWITVSALVMSDSIIRHYVEGQLAFTYYRPVQYAGSVSGNTVPIVNNTPIKDFYISLQSESAPTRFRKVDLLNLEGCMTTTDANYKSYLVKHDATACAGTTGIKGVSERDARDAVSLAFVGNGVRVGGSGKVSLEVYDTKGTLTAHTSGTAPMQWNIPVHKGGMHLIKVTTAKGVYTETAMLF